MPVSAYIQSDVFFILAAAALFASAGTIAIAAFWVYLGIFAAVFVASLLWLDPDLARERMRPGGRKPPLGLRLFAAVLPVHWIIAGLDRGRFHWSDDVPAWLQAGGLVTVAAGYTLCLSSMAVNRFFSSAIRIQTDRGQHVITAGPYAVIRHPGYVCRGHCHRGGQRHGPRVMARGGVPGVHQHAVPASSRGDRRPHSSGRASGLSGVRRTRSLAASAGHLVRGSRALIQIFNLAS